MLHLRQDPAGPFTLAYKTGHFFRDAYISGYAFSVSRANWSKTLTGNANRGGAANRSAVTMVIRREEGTEQSPHHGGAWKVAYADFVTAMMAFFLLMWLLNATTEEQRTGLADYFAPTNLFGRTVSGSGQPFGGQTPDDPGTSASDTGTPRVIAGPHHQPQSDDDDALAALPATRADVAADATGSGPSIETNQAAAPDRTRPGEGRQRSTTGGDYPAAELLQTAAIAGTAAAPNSVASKEAVRSDAERERRALAQAGAQLSDAIRREPALQELASQLSIQVVPEGLRIQVVDAERRPMFSLGGAAPTPQVRDLMRKVASALAALPNEISIAGHTDSLTFKGQDKGNWELSTERAHAVRRILTEDGLAENRIRSVTGNADRDLLVPASPFSPINRRISIIVLRHAGTGQLAGANS